MIDEDDRELDGHRRSIATLLRDERRLATLLVGAAVLVFVAGRLELASRIAAPQLLCDEFIYAEVARSIAEHGAPLLRGLPTRQNVLYPALMAPGWLFGPAGTAYAIAKVLNVLVMSSAGVITYVWARRLVRPLLALVAAVLVLAMPWFEYTGLLMTENVFLPLFVGAAFVSALALERPTPRRQFAALAVIAVAALARTQGLVLLAVLATAVVAFALLEAAATKKRVLDLLRPWWTSAAVVAGLAVVYVVVAAARNASWTAVFGDYSVFVRANASAAHTVHWTAANLAAITLTAGVVPLAALIALTISCAARPAACTGAERAFVAIAASAVAWMAVEVGGFGAEIHSVGERYLFYIEPLLFLGLLTWFARPRPVHMIALLAGAVAVFGLILVLPRAYWASSALPNNVGLYAIYDTWTRVGGTIDRFEWLVRAVAVAALALLLLAPRRAALTVLVVAVGGWLMLSSYRVHAPVGRQAANSAAVLGPDKSWIDDAVGRGAHVTYLFTATPDTAFERTRIALETEFWNRSVRSVTSLGGNELCQLPERSTIITPGKAGLAVVPQPPEPYAVALSSDRVPIGEVVATGLQQTLYRIQRPFAFESFTSGITSDGWTGPEPAFWVHLGRRPGLLVTTLSRAAWPGPDLPGHVTIAAAPAAVHRTSVKLGRPYWQRRWTVHSSASRTFRIPIPGRAVAVRIRVSPTFSPADYGYADTRRLGVQPSFTFVPASARRGRR